MIPFRESLELIHQKRRSFQPLCEEEFALLLADCLLDRQLFSSPSWGWRYGGVRYAPSDPPAGKPERILVLQWPGSLGDVCMGAPFLSVLRQKHPSSEIHLLTSGSGEIFAGSPDLDALLPNPLDAHLDDLMHGRPPRIRELLTDILSLTAGLKGGRYDLCVNLQVLPLSASLTRLSGAAETIGMTLSDDGLPLIRGNVWAPYLFGVSANLMRRFNPLHRTEIFCRMVDGEQRFKPDPAVSISQEAVRSVQELIDGAGVLDSDLLIGMHPMAGTPIRQWPHFGQLAGRLRDELGAKILVFGSRSEDEEVGRIVEKAGKGVVKATHLGLQELMAALSGCDLLISNDSGPMHLACLLRRKVVALFGPTSHVEVGPWGTEFDVLQSGRCRNCFKQSCEREDVYCMAQIRTEDVMSVLSPAAGGAPRRKCGRILCHSSKSDRTETGELAQGRLLLDVIGKGKGSASRDMFSSGDFKRLLRECSRARGVIERSLKGLQSQGGDTAPGRLPVHDLAGAESILNPLIVLNDLQYVDKRNPMESDYSACRAFYSALLRDVSSVAGRLERMRWAAPRPDQPASTVRHEL